MNRLPIVIDKYVTRLECANTKIAEMEYHKTYEYTVEHKIQYAILLNSKSILTNIIRDLESL